MSQLSWKGRILPCAQALSPMPAIWPPNFPASDFSSVKQQQQQLLTHSCDEA